MSPPHFSYEDASGFVVAEVWQSRVQAHRVRVALLSVGEDAGLAEGAGEALWIAESLLGGAEGRSCSVEIVLQQLYEAEPAQRVDIAYAIAGGACPDDGFLEIDHRLLVSR